MTVIQGKVAAITGAASGIGRALVQALVARGAQVAIADVDEIGLRETATLVHRARKASTHLVDVRSRADVERFAREVEAEHGGADIIINNAGVVVGATMEEVTYEELALVLDVNLWGVLYGTKAFLPLFRQRGAGHIVNVSSINAMVPFPRNGAYNISKYAVHGLNETLMQELRETPIRITGVYPGGVKTNIARHARHLTPHQTETFTKNAKTSPAEAAEAILRAVERNREYVYVGTDAKLMALAKRVAPAWTVSAASWLTRRVFAEPEQEAPQAR